jgi:orotate phosphoribosyltransferase
MEGIVTASQRLWLVDDVLTTGNTLRAVAKVLGVEGSCGWIVAVVATYSPAEERLWAEEREGLFNEVRKGLDAAGGRQKD